MEDNSKVDMVFYNRQMKEIERELFTSPYTEQKIEQLESRYDCTILFLGEKNYEDSIQTLISENAVIFDYYEDGSITGKVAWTVQKNKYEKWRKLVSRQMLIAFVSFACCGYLLLLAVYFQFVRPFHVLQRFSREIAKGNLDFPLPIEKYNVFGAFTESFDLMREELKRARESEYQANVSKKELVAELSHDMKTPISTIKATCEVLQVKEKDTAALDKLSLISSKTDTINQLIDNMFHATMEELEVLKVEAAEESSLCILGMLQDFQHYGNIEVENRIPECLLLLDKLRLEQVIGNIIHNSYKYAKTTVWVKFFEEDQGIRIEIHDAGTGIPEEELALVTEKFYRGSNAKGMPGSGLGLYLAKYFMEQMGGGLEYYNAQGFTVALFLRKA